MPKISIIIPVYNTEKYLKECLDSVINQTLQDIEIICVDDGSTDNSLNILKEYALKDNRIKILNQKNLHAGVARNNGIKVATGEWIHFLDSDDWIDLDTYEKLYNIANNQKAQVIKFKSYCYDDKNKCLQYNDYEEMSSITNERFNDYINLDNDINILQLVMDSPWSGLYRTNFLKENLIYFDNLLCANDTSFYYRCLVNARTIFLSSEHFVYYRRNIDTSLVSIRPQNFNCQIEQFYIIQDLIRNENIELQEIIKQKLVNSLMARTRHYLYNKKLPKIIKNKIKKEIKMFCKKEHINISNFIEPYFKRFIQTIFSIKNSSNKKHKIITVLGIKIKIKRNKYAKD